MHPVVVLLLIATSAYGKVVLNDEKLPVITENNLINPGKVMEADTKVVPIAEKTDNGINNNLIIDDELLKPVDVPKINKTGDVVNDTVSNVNATELYPAIPTINNGTALILTPYVDQGRIAEARNASSVDPELFMGVKSYSGFLTVNKTYNSNLFFWYFPVEKKPLNKTPWIIWLQGGPGISSLVGLFDEIGPFRVKYGTLRRNQYTWLQNHSLVFIDNPVGSGYSFTEHPDGYTKDMDTYGKHLYEALTQLVQIFPELHQAPLYVAGESYAGKYVPALALEIHKHKHEPKGNLNFQGIMMGNAYVEPSMISQLPRAFYYFGLLAKEQLDIVKPLVDAFNQDIAANRSVEAKEKFNGLITILLFLSHQRQGYNFLRDEVPVGHFFSLLDRSDIKRALHVGDINFSFINITVNTIMAADFLSNARPLVETLLNHYRVLVYCGHLDQMLSCTSTSESYRNWKWDHSDKFLEATRYPYLYNNHLSGYHKTGGGLTEAIFRGAGHMVPFDVPGAAQDFITRWITNSLIIKEEKEDKQEIHQLLAGFSDNIDQNVIDCEVPLSIDQAELSVTVNDTVIAKSEPISRVDNGTALILTPFLEQGRIEEARNASSVNPELFMGLKSYSGFLTVNKTFNSNMFFWYFPVEKKPVNETPWIIWLQGGPGASSLTGLFDEIGPFKSSHGTLQRNQYTWLQNHSLVFIDNPVGSGYSFTNHTDGYAKDMPTYAKHLYKALSQFLQLFPELRQAPLYVAGESYAGKYVPALGMEIHKHKHLPGGEINLEGFILGNAYVEPAMITQFFRTFYYFGILSKEQLDSLKPLIDSFHKDIAANRSIEAKYKFVTIIRVLLILSQQKQIYNFLKDDLPLGLYTSFLERSDVKRALHVGDTEFAFINMTVNTHLEPDFLSNARPLFETLLNHYRVLTYCGHLDQMLPCAFTAEVYRTWKWDNSQEFLEASRFPYIFNKRLAGYHKTGGGLTEVVVRGAGHMAAFDAPAPTQELVARWTHQRPLSFRFGMLEGSFVEEYVRNFTSSRQ